MNENLKTSNVIPKDILQKILNHFARNDQEISDLKKSKQNRIDPTVDLTNKDLLSLIEKRFNEIDQKFDKQNDKFDKIDQKFDKQNDKFDKIDQKFDKQNDKFDEMNQKFDKQNDKFDKMNSRFNHMLYVQFGTIITILLAGITILVKLNTLT